MSSEPLADWEREFLESQLPKITDVERLTLKPGDALVIRFPGQAKISDRQADDIKQRVRAILRLDDSVPILILPAGASAQVIESPP